LVPSAHEKFYCAVIEKLTIGVNCKRSLFR